MAKSSGLGDNFYVGGSNLSGDTNSLSNVSGSVALIDVTGLPSSAYERIGGLRDGAISWVSYWNPTGAHPVLSVLPTTDIQLAYFRGTGIGSPAACMNGLQLNYDPTRAADGSITVKVDAQADGFGLEWGEQLTAGIRTDTAATNGAAQDDGAATAFGFQAYLQVFSFVGTDATIKIQDSADNSTFADLASGAFTQVTAAPVTQRIAVGGAAAVRRYVRASTVTTGGFTSLAFAVVLVRNTVAVTF